MGALSNVLLINRDDLMTWTGINGNIDTDKMLPHVMTATDIHLQVILGTKLLDKCRQLVKDDELNLPENTDYENLVTNYITPVLVYYTMWDMMPFLTYSIQNGGIFQHQSENSASPDEAQMHMLIKRFKDKGEFYGRRLNDFMCANTTLFPEYHENGNGDMYGGSKQTFNGIVWGN